MTVPVAPQLISPPRLRPGATVGIVAPAGPVLPDRLRRGLACLGDAFRLRIADSVTAPHPPDTPSYLAASDDVRAAELTAMLADPDVRAIVLARGGYGIMRILPRLDPDLLRRDPKPIVGFSDATALLAWTHHAGVRAIHGPVIAQLADLPPSDTAHLIRVLTDPAPLGERPWPLRVADGAPDGAVGKLRHHGPLIPANLSLAAFLIGTPWQLPLDGAIALFEEIGEKPYAIDRYLTQLTLAGALAGTCAAVIGDLTRCHDPKPPNGAPDPDGAALAVMIERLHAAAIPVVSGAPIGHGARNEAIPFGARCELDLSRGSLAILDAAVA
ncbi:MAG TPA: LD-carboxypeptidase [Kofleriaceae bacterium]|jgi:muramoyltetrapeptide carboxypeptidase|nr:LD-carboxypeptidase [Kofleriaceae bacterium]